MNITSPRPKTRVSRWGTMLVALVATATLASAFAATTPASAATLLPENVIKDTSGNPILPQVTPSTGSFADAPTSVTVSQPCPDPFNQAASIIVNRADTPYSSTTNNRALGLAERPEGNSTVLTGGPGPTFEVFSDGGASGGSSWNGSNGAQTFELFGSGTYELLVVCRKAGALPDRNMPGPLEPYFRTTVTVDATAKTWKVGDTSTPSEPRQTTTAIAVSDVAAASAMLTASVTPAAASGEVVFKHGETELGREPVAGGVASIQATLPAATSFPAGAITAEFTPTDPDAFVASTGQAPAFSTAAASGTIGIGGSVPAASDPGVPSGLKLQIASGDVKLQNTQARVSGQSWTASGDTPNITVLDDRRNASAQAWTLNGRSSKFSDGAKEIAAAQLGWTPALVSAAETANLAAVVTGGVEGGLSTDKALATGPTPTTGVDVSAAVKANLALVVPSTAEAGQNYTATLTLTLI